MSNPNGMAGASLSTQGLGGLMQAMGTFSNARTDKRAAQSNATYAEYQAEDAKHRGDLALQQVRRNTSQVKGSQRAGLAAKGLDITEGSPLALLTDTDYFGAVDENIVKENTAREVQGFRTAGSNYAAEAKGINPWLAAGASGLATAGTVADRWYQYKTSGIKPFGKK